MHQLCCQPCINDWFLLLQCIIDIYSLFCIFTVPNNYLLFFSWNCLFVWIHASKLCKCLSHTSIMITDFTKKRLFIGTKQNTRYCTTANHSYMSLLMSNCAMSTGSCNKRHIHIFETLILRKNPFKSITSWKALQKFKYRYIEPFLICGRICTPKVRIVVYGLDLNTPLICCSFMNDISCENKSAS